MSETDDAIDRVHMDDVIAGRSDIEELEQIEDALMVIKAAQHKVDFLRRLKQHRVRAIDAEVKSQEARVQSLKDAIAKCMAAKGEKTIDFPDLAKITTRKTKGTWIIKDDQSLAKHLQGLGKFDDVGQFIVKFDKTKLNKTLNELETFNNTSVAVEREPEKEGLSVSFHESTVPLESIDDLLPAPLPKPVIPVGISIVPNRKMDISDEPFDFRGLNF